MPAVSKGDGMRGLAVFISDIRNCKFVYHIHRQFLVWLVASSLVQRRSALAIWQAVSRACQGMCPLPLPTFPTMSVTLTCQSGLRQPLSWLAMHLALVSRQPPVANVMSKGVDRTANWRLCQTGIFCQSVAFHICVAAFQFSSSFVCRKSSEFFSKSATTEGVARLCTEHFR